MGSKLMRGVGAFGLGLAAGGMAAYDAYKSRKKTENSLLKAMGKTAQVKEPTFKDFFDESTIGKKINGTQAPAPARDAMIKPVESAPEPVAPEPAATVAETSPSINDDTNKAYADLRSEVVGAPEPTAQKFDQAMWDEAPDPMVEETMLP